MDNLKLLKDIKRNDGGWNVTLFQNIVEIDELEEEAKKWIKEIAKGEDIDISKIELESKSNEDYTFTYNGETKVYKEEQLNQAMALAQIAWIMHYFSISNDLECKGYSVFED